MIFLALRELIVDWWPTISGNQKINRVNNTEISLVIISLSYYLPLLNYGLNAILNSAWKLIRRVNFLIISDIINWCRR